jgi:hypothetical protein
MIHPLDALAGLALAEGPRRLKFFSQGWGDESLIDPSAVLGSPPEPIAISWLSCAQDASGHVVSHGSFTSPAPHLPSRSKMGTVISIAPEGGSHRAVVLMPAWNEHDPKVRIALADRLANRGIRSIILENPYYGTRHPAHGGGQPISTVSDFMVMGGGAVIEARGILTALHDAGSRVGVAGYSMGGNTAALVSATVDFPIATAPLAASHSPGPVFLDGVLKRGIDWDALGGRAAEPRLRAALSSVSVLNLDPKPHSAHAVVVAAASDGYVPASATRLLVDHWRGSELRVLAGGHASLIWFRKDRLTDAIVDAFRRIEDARMRVQRELPLD